MEGNFHLLYLYFVTANGEYVLYNYVVVFLEFSYYEHHLQFKFIFLNV